MTKVETILDRANRFENNHVRALYHVKPDNGNHYCRCCANREVACGLFSCDQAADHDVVPTCYKCQKWLCGVLTVNGAKDILEYFEESGFNPRTGQDCWLWSLCNDSFTADEIEQQQRLHSLIRSSV
jgi:hypothetical protein